MGLMTDVLVCWKLICTACNNKFLQNVMKFNEHQYMKIFNKNTVQDLPSFHKNIFSLSQIVQINIFMMHFLNPHVINNTNQTLHNFLKMQ